MRRAAGSKRFCQGDRPGLDRRQRDLRRAIGGIETGFALAWRAFRHPQWRGASSDRFLTHAVALAREAGYAIGHVDLTLVCEAPRIAPHKPAMRARLAEILGLEPAAVNVKATTTERLGFTGRGEGIAAQAVATLYPINPGTC